MGIVVERHGTECAGPVTIVFEYDETAGDAECLERGEILQTLCVGHAVVALTGDDERGRGKVLHIVRRAPLLIEI